MRIRQVKPEFWSDVKMYGLPPAFKLFYIGLWNEADDAGWLRWDPEQLAADLFRDLPPAEAEALISEAGLSLSAKGRLRILKCGHAQIPNLPKHQHLAGPTRRVYTVQQEHSHCRAPRVPAGPRTDEIEHVPAGTRGSPRIPARLGQVRLGNQRARARRAVNGVTPEQVASHVKAAGSSDKAMASAGLDWLKAHGLNKEGAPIEP